MAIEKCDNLTRTDYKKFIRHRENKCIKTPLSARVKVDTTIKDNFEGSLKEWAHMNGFMFMLTEDKQPQMPPMMPQRH